MGNGQSAAIKRMAQLAQVIATLMITAVLCAPEPVRAAGGEVAAGQKYFVRYCASCHGTDGTGNGPVAKALSTRPANLRMLADKYGMPLNAPKLAAVIDGRDTLRAHGTHDMPVWGEQLYTAGPGERGELGIGEAIGDIIAYLNTIQDRRSAQAEMNLRGVHTALNPRVVVWH